MPKTEHMMHAIEIDYLCDWCEKGHMRWRGMTLTVHPPLYPHQCDNGQCLRVANLDRTYPHIEHRRKRLWQRRDKPHSAAVERSEEKK